MSFSFVRENHATVQTWLGRRFSCNENLERKQNWTAKSKNLKETAGKVKSVFVIREPREPKNLDVALNIARVEKYARKTCGSGQHWGHSMKGVLVTVEICVLCGWWFSNRFDLYIVPETPSIQLAVSCSELFFARCCALKRTETFRVGKQGYEFVSQSLKSDGLMFHSWHQSVWRRTKEVPQHGGSILDSIILPGTFRRKC